MLLAPIKVVLLYTSTVNFDGHDHCLSPQGKESYP